MKNNWEYNRVRNQKTNSFFFLMYCLVVLINPFPLGSNRVWAWSFEAMIVVGLLLIMIICSFFSRHCVSWQRLKKLKYELILICFWLLIHLLYVIPVPLDWLSAISPTVGLAYAGINNTYGYLSLDVYSSYETLLLSFYYFLVFILGVVLINSRKRIILILSLFLLLGVFESIYGMYLVSIGQTGTMVQINTVLASHASGTFINKNHMVAFIAMCFLAGLSLRFLLKREHANNDHLMYWVRLVKYVAQPKRLIDFSLFIIFAGIWSTHSRAGLASFLFAGLFFCITYFFTRRQKTLKINLIFLILVAVIFLLATAADDVNYLLANLGQNSEDGLAYLLDSAKGRFLAINQVVEHYTKYWFSGVGPGAYQVFFVNHRIKEQAAYFDHAHNDYIEFIIEYGIFSIILLSVIVMFIYRLLKFISKCPSRFYQVTAIGTTSCIIYMLLHGNMDFNARIPANVVTLIVMISVIYGKIVMFRINNVKK